MTVTATLVTARKASGFQRVYPIGAVPATPGYPYVVIGYSPDAPLVRSLDGSSVMRRRFTVQHFSRTADGLETVTTDSYALFDGQHLDLPDSPLCEQEIATAVDRDPDDQGVLGSTHTYLF